jgi:hypothetical protein
MGTVVPNPLGRVNGMSTQRGSTEGQSALVAQNAEQWPIAEPAASAKHCPLWQYCVGSVREAGRTGQTAPEARVALTVRQ